MKIKYLNHEELEKLWDSYDWDSDDAEYSPKGLFIHYDKKANTWVAVDNDTGDAWTEEFDTKEQAIAWLNGESFDETENLTEKPTDIIVNRPVFNKEIQGKPVIVTTNRGKGVYFINEVKEESLVFMNSNGNKYEYTLDDIQNGVIEVKLLDIDE